MRTYLDVPFAERETAKQLGARWDPERKKWFVQDRANLWPFLGWVPAHLLKHTGLPGKRRRPNRN